LLFLSYSLISFQSSQFVSFPFQAIERAIQVLESLGGGVPDPVRISLSVNNLILLFGSFFIAIKN
jgi:hypothetical protein